MRYAPVFCLALAAAFAAAPARAVTAEELIAKNLAARGGDIHAVQTLRLEGKISFNNGNFKADYVQLHKRPDSFRSEVSLQGMTAVESYDGHEGWRIQPFFGRKDPERMTADDVKELQDDAPIGGPLPDWKARGSKIAYLGTEDIDGTEAHKLKITLANGDEQVVYLDPDHFLEIRIESKRTVRGVEEETVADFSDYEKVAGVYFPLEISSGRKGAAQRSQITFEKAEANVPLDDSIFHFPATATAANK